MNANFENVNITEDLSSGLHSVLYKKIGSVNINEVRISNVFSRFIKDVECADSFTVIDIINCAEAVVKGKEPNENAGNLIYAYDHQEISNKSILKKLLIILTEDSIRFCPCITELRSTFKPSATVFLRLKPNAFWLQSPRRRRSFLKRQKQIR